MQISFNIDNIDQVGFLGVNNINFNTIVRLFPKLKLIHRGSKITAIGDEATIVLFEDIFERLLNYFDMFQKIDPLIIEGIVAGETDKIQPRSKDVIVFGNKGKIIQAKTGNQVKLANAIEKNDLVFAIGPAGTGKTYVAIALAVRALKTGK